MTGQNPSLLYTISLPEEKRGVYILQCFKRLQVLAREGYSCLRSEYISVSKDTFIPEGIYIYLVYIGYTKVLYRGRVQG